MTLHSYRSRQVHETLNGVNPSSSFRDMCSAKSGSNLWQIWQVFGPWASLHGANRLIIMTVHNYRPRQFRRTSNGENPSSSYRDMGSASLAAGRPPANPPARTVTTIPLQLEGLRGEKYNTDLVRNVGVKFLVRVSFSKNVLLTKPINTVILYIECRYYSLFTRMKLPKYIGQTDAIRAKMIAQTCWLLLANWPVPADTRRKNNVVMTSKRRRFHVIMT